MNATLVETPTTATTEAPAKVKRNKKTTLHVFILNDRTQVRTWARTDATETGFALSVKKVRRASRTLKPEAGDTFTFSPAQAQTLIPIGVALDATTSEKAVCLTWDKSALANA